ncbi:MAG: signal peptidase I [Fusobacteriota bacterium]
MNEIIINGLIYLILTSFLIYIWVNEKKIAKIIKNYRETLSNKIIYDWNLNIKKRKIKYITVFHSAFNLFFIILFYNFFMTNGLLILVGILNIIAVFFKEVKDVKSYPSMFIINVIIIGLQKLILHTQLPTIMILYFIINALIYLIYVFTDEGSIRKFVDYTETLVTALVLVLLIQHFYLGNFLVPTGSMEKTIMPKDRLFGNMVVYNFKKPDRGDILVFKEPVQNKVLYTKRLIGLPGEKVYIEDGNVYINGEKLTDDIYQNNYTQVGHLDGKTWKVPKKGDKVRIIGGEVLNKNGKIELQEDLDTIQSYISKNPDKVTEIIPVLKFELNGKEETGPILDFMYDEKKAQELLNGESITLDENYYFVLGDNSDNSYDSRFWGFVSEDRIKGKPFFRFWPLNRLGFLKHEEE